MFHANYFRAAAIDSIGDTAITYALVAARWGVLAWDAATSDRAIAAYRQGWQLARATALFCIGLGIITRRAVQDWVDAQVEGATPKALAPAAPLPLPPAAEPEAVDPFDPSVNPLPTPAVVEDVARELEMTCLEGCSIRTLKGLARGKVKGYGNMTKTQLVEALRAA